MAYSDASKKEKSQILDMLCEVTGWNRDHARHQLRARLEQPPGRAQATVAVIDRRKQKPRKYSYDALLVLQRVWAISGGECGKYLAVAMEDLLDALEAHGRLVVGQRRYSLQVRAELLEMSPATIDRYLAPTRAKDSRVPPHRRPRWHPTSSTGFRYPRTRSARGPGECAASVSRLC